MGTNTIISKMFAQMANVLFTLRDDPFKIAAYRKAAKVLADYPIDVEEAYRGAAPYHSDILIDGVSLCDRSRPWYVLLMHPCTASLHPLFYIFNN